MTGLRPGDNRVGVGPSQGYCLGGQPVPDLPHRVFARLGQQLAAEPADLEPQEVHPLVQMGDLRLVLVEGQATGFQPSGEPCLDLLGLLPGVAESDQVVSVADQERAAGDCIAVPVVPDPGCLFHAVQCHVHEQRAGHPALWGALAGRGENSVLDHARFQPLAHQAPCGEGAQRREDVIVAEPVERRLEVGVQCPHPLRGPAARGGVDGHDRVVAAPAGPEPVGFRLEP